MRTSKKAQAQQIFIFIIAIVIASMIFLYGYKAIRDFTKRTEEISLVRFQTELQSAVRTISPDYGSIKKLELSVPSNYEKVCFVNSEYNDNADICTPTTEDYNPIICDAWQAGTQNVFLVPMANVPIKVSTLEITNEQGYLCQPVIHGKIVIRLEGKGNRALLDVWE